jgi:hypothetical protein
MVGPKPNEMLTVPSSLNGADVAVNGKIASVVDPFL